MTGKFSPKFNSLQNDKLKRSEARFRAAVEAVQGILWTNDASGQMRGEQPGWAALTGQSVEEYEGYGWSNAVHPDDSAATVDAWNRAVEEKRTFVFEHRLRRHDGVWRRFSVRAIPVFDDVHEITEWVGVHTDITGRHEAYTALSESEARFRNMADNAPVMIWVTNPDGNCTYLNARWYEFTGQTPEEAAGFGWLEATHPEDKATAEQTFLDSNSRRVPFRLDYRLRRADGIYRWALDAASPRFDAGGTFQGYVGSVIDIDERREIEGRLRDLNALLAQRVDDTLAERKVLADIVEGTDAFVQVVDLEYRWLAINKAAADEFERIYGVRPAVGDCMLDVLAGMPEHQTAVQAVWSRALAGEEFVETGEYGDVNRDRRFYEMKYNVLRDGYGIQTGAYQFVYDVTERIQEQERLAEAEAAHRQSDALYRAYFQNSPEALFVVRVEDENGFVVEEINPAHERGVGFKLEEIRGKRVNEFLPEAASRRVQETYQQVLSTGNVYQYSEAFELDGEYRHWETSLLPVRGPTGNVERIIGSSRDVTRRIQAEELLRQSQKMDAMGQLTGGVAHDFNNLLTPIVGALDILQRRNMGNDREKKLIEGAAQSADRAKILVQRLLAFARRQPLQAVAVDLRLLVDNMADLIMSTTGPQVDVTVDIADDLPPAVVDANQVEMALLNLAVNARDAMPDGGTLRISVNVREIESDNPLGIQPGDYICLTVADNGIGMDDLVKRQAIEPFFSTKGIGKGTGLGLSMVHGLAAQLGGGLEIHSRKGVGTNVSLLLPASLHTVDEVEEPDITQPGIKRHGIALLVDDESLVRMTTADMLSDLGFDVIEADSAEQALELVRQGLKPQLLISDHLMPGITGPELARTLKADNPNLKVLIVSGYADSSGVDPDLPRLTKPFLSRELATALAEFDL